MEKRYGLVTDYSGNVVPGSTITVTNYPAGTIASLFRDNAGTPEDNPFVANAPDGRYTFYAADGRYRIDIAPPLDANLSASSVIDVILSDTAYLQKASKAEVAALPLTQYDAGKKVFITSDDGGPGTIRYDAGGGHSDDGGPAVGTKFIINSDPTIYWERDYFGPLNVKWFRVSPSESATNNSIFFANALAAGAGRKVYVPAGEYETNDAILPLSGTHLFGDGDTSIIKSNAQTNGGSGIGQRQIQLNNVTGVEISNLKLDCSGITVFLAGVSAIRCINSTDYRIHDVTFVTPGAAVASITSSYYWIYNNKITVSATDSTGHHDGLIDQWAGSHHFHIYGNETDGATLIRYLILVTGQTTAGVAAACYDFNIYDNTLSNALNVGIWINGRQGVNHDFNVYGNLVKDISNNWGIAVSDAYAFTVNGNTTNNTAGNGIRLYQESTGGGTFSCKDFTVSNNVIYNPNANSNATIEGAGILVFSDSQGGIIDNNRVKGTNHTYAIWLGDATTGIEVAGQNYDVGTSGYVYNTVLANITPYGWSYTPTLTAVANVSASTPRACRVQRSGNTVYVSGRVEITPTAGGSAATQLGISLPIASNFTNNQIDAAGVGATQFGTVAACYADATNNRITFEFPAPGTTVNFFYFNFEYTIK